MLARPLGPSSLPQSCHRETIRRTSTVIYRLDSACRVLTTLLPFYIVTVVFYIRKVNNEGQVQGFCLLLLHLSHQCALSQYINHLVRVKPYNFSDSIRSIALFTVAIDITNLPSGFIVPNHLWYFLAMALRVISGLAVTLMVRSIG